MTSTAHLRAELEAALATSARHVEHGLALEPCSIGQGHLAHGRKAVLELLAAVVLGDRLRARGLRLAGLHCLLGVDVKRANAFGQTPPVLVDLELVIVRVVFLVTVVGDELGGRLSRRELGNRDEHLASVAPGLLDELDCVGHLRIRRLDERIDCVDLIAVRIADGLEGRLTHHRVREPALFHEALELGNDETLPALEARLGGTGGDLARQALLACRSDNPDGIIHRCSLEQLRLGIAQDIA